jgi:hypothetical protein
MSLAVVFDTMHALVTGTMTEEEAALRLHGSADAKRRHRLHCYRRNYLINVRELVESHFPLTTRVAVGLVGRKTWDALVETLGTQHPMLGSIRFGTAGLVEFLAGPHAARGGLPGWLSELADLEHAERTVFLAPDPDPEARSGSPSARAGLCLADPNRIRDYHHDVLAVRSAADPTAITVTRRRNVVCTWRGPDGRRWTKAIGATELRVLQAAFTGRFEVELVARAAKVAPSRIDEIVRRLVACSLLRRGGEG